jgi:tripartite-type tricarboxylate transporter receptor subunit TctC
MGNVPYDVEKDFTAITNLGSVPLLVTAYPGIPAKNLKEFLDAIRADPKKYVFGTSAVGSASHLAEEAIKYEAKVDFAIIPYKGTSPALTDVMGRSHQRDGRCAAIDDAAREKRQAEAAGGHHREAVAVTARRADGGRVGPRRIRDGVVVRLVGAAESPPDS